MEPHISKISPTLRTGAESTDDAEHKSALPYMARPRLACEPVTRLVLRQRMKARFCPRYPSALMLMNQTETEELDGLVIVVLHWSIARQTAYSR